MSDTKLMLEPILERVFAYMTADRHSGNWGMDIGHWDWVPGVGIISILDYGQAAGRGRRLCAGVGRAEQAAGRRHQGD